MNRDQRMWFSGLILGLGLGMMTTSVLFTTMILMVVSGESH